MRVDLCVGGGAYVRGAYTWSNKSVKEKVGLSAGGPTYGRGLIGGEIRYVHSRWGLTGNGDVTHR